MYKSHFGRNGQVSFSCPEDYYELLGYLAKSDGSTSITWENNEDQGAWGSEGRIVFIQEDFRPQDAYVLRQGTAQYTKELTVMISLSIFQDIMASYKVSIKMSSLFAGQFLNNI